MGCGTAQSKHFELEDHDKIIDTSFSLLNCQNDEIKNQFNEAKELLNQIENYRKLLIDQLEDLSFSTGAFCYTDELSLQSCIESFLWLLSTNSKGNISLYQIKFSLIRNPYLTFLGGTKEDMKIGNEINKYINDLLEIKPHFENTIKKYNDIYSLFAERNEDILADLLLKENFNEKEKENFILNFKNNVSLITRPMEEEVIKKIKEIFAKDTHYINEVTLCEADFVDKINSIGKKASGKKLNNQYEIAYYQWQQSNPNGKETLKEKKEAFQIRIHMKNKAKINIIKLKKNQID